MDWSGQNVLITGADGFIGSHLTETLHSLGANCRALTYYNARSSWGWLDDSPIAKDLEVFHGDIRDREFMQAAIKGCDYVFHLAALIGIPYSYQAPRSYIDTNITGSLNVFQACLDHDVKRVIHTSTSEVYGTALYVPIDEKHPLQGQSPYSASKIGADKIAESFHCSFDLALTTVRPFNTYGPRQSARAIIPTIITQALSSNQIQLGSLTPTRDLNYVQDTVDGFIAAAESDKAIGEVINIGTGQEISMGDLAQSILDIMDIDAQIVSKEDRKRPEKSEVNRLLADNSKANELLNWAPKVSLKEGLKKSIDWFSQDGRLNIYKPDKYTV